MAKKIIKAQMKQRRDTRANWAATNPVLLDGELGIVSDDPNLYKVGDGTTAWNVLPFRGFDGTLVHETGTSDTSVMSQKAVTEALTDLEQELKDKVDNLPKGDVFNSKGRYPDLSVGFADDLVGRGESVPAEFSFRASGGKSIKDGTARIKRLKGNSVVWNQLFDMNTADRTYNENGVHITDNMDGSYTISTDDGGATQQVNRALANTHNLSYAGHKILITGCDGAVDGFGFWDSYSNTIGTNFKNNVIVSATKNGSVAFSMVIIAGKVVPQTTWKPRVYDLTQMFGAGNEPTTFEEYEARKLIVEDEFAYNEGEVIHMTAEGIKSVGDNAWDEQWESGIINYDTGNDINYDTGNDINYDTGHCRTVGYVQVIPNEAYYISFPTASFPSDLVVICYDENKAFIQHIGGGSANKTFTIPANCHYIRFTWVGTEYNNNIMLTLVHSGWKQDTDAGYQPYWQDRLIFDQRIKDEFPDGMKKWDMVYNKDGKGYIVKGTGVVDMGDLDWSLFEGSETFMYTQNTAAFYDGQQLLCAKTFDRIAVYGSNSILRVYTSAYTDAASFKAAMAGVLLYYQLAGPTIIEYDEPFNLDYKVADFGTEQAIAEQPSAPISADVIYQFNAVDMIREHELEIAELQSIIATMQAQLAILTNKE